MHNCPCCGEITYSEELLCSECEHEGCMMSRAADGELGWWNCQRPDAYDDLW